MSIVNRLINSLWFWAAWIIIPLIMEIVPSIGSFFVLIKQKIKSSLQAAKPIIYPDISIIIPVYNSADTLEDCIRSVYESDYPNDKIRIFLVDNQGSDNSFQIYTQCQDKYEGLLMQWLSAEQGKSRALNMALYNSNGKYIIHIDSDGVLEPSALRHMVDKFEADISINCMTGAIMTLPEKIEHYPHGVSRLLRKLEFLEYANAFLAGRNYASETNGIYTLSGAFSAFRKSAILSSWLYNTDTICEDTQITFQMRYQQHEKIKISEKSIFFVDPIESVNKLYTQRQRWQRGSLEVSQMFLTKRMWVHKLFTDINVKTLMYDHTFALPRFIWYFALLCLIALGYSGKTVLQATGLVLLLYTLCGFFYFWSVRGFLSEFRELQHYYSKQWWIVPLLPLYNMVVFFIRLAGIINSIGTDSAWRTQTLTDEKETFLPLLRNDWDGLIRRIAKLRSIVNYDTPKQKTDLPSSKELSVSGWRYSIIILTYLISTAFFFLCRWTVSNFDVGLEEMIHILTGSLKETDMRVVYSALRFCLPPILIMLLVCLLCISLDKHTVKRQQKQTDLSSKTDYKKIKRLSFFRHLAAIGAVAYFLCSIIYAGYQFNLPAYAKARIECSSENIILQTESGTIIP